MGYIGHKALEAALPQLSPPLQQPHTAQPANALGLVHGSYSELRKANGLWLDIGPFWCHKYGCALVFILRANSDRQLTRIPWTYT